MTRKLTVTETRAKAYCDRLIECFAQQYATSYPITVEWKKSRTWGSNPVIYSGFNDHKMTNVSGCGYDKLSTALADVLRFLFPVGSPESRDIHSQGGCGEQSVINTLAKYGWVLEPVAKAKSSDSYRLSRAK